MSVIVRIPTPLRAVTNGQDKASVEGETLTQVIDDLESQYTGIRERLCDESGNLRHFVNIYVNGEDVRFLEGLGTAISSGDEVSIVPAVAGGAK
jgi:molybdopterin synthase sulfur carrier subunit